MSGAAYGNVFAEPITTLAQAAIAINDIKTQDYYATAKLHAEVRHRARSDLGIIDIRVFYMFSRTQSISSSFLITAIVRAIRDRRTLLTSAEYMIRDFMHPEDFHQVVECLLAGPPMAGPPTNCAVDCYSREPIDKPAILQAMRKHFGLHYELVVDRNVGVNATGSKSHYYSLNQKAAEFGFQPAWSSLECVLAETEAILGGTTQYANKV